MLNFSFLCILDKASELAKYFVSVNRPSLEHVNAQNVIL